MLNKQNEDADHDPTSEPTVIKTASQVSLSILAATVGILVLAWLGGLLDVDLVTPDWLKLSPPKNSVIWLMEACEHEGASSVDLIFSNARGERTAEYTFSKGRLSVNEKRVGNVVGAAE